MLYPLLSPLLGGPFLSITKITFATEHYKHESHSAVNTSSQEDRRFPVSGYNSLYRRQ